MLCYPLIGTCPVRSACLMPLWSAAGMPNTARLYYGMAPDGSICDDGKYHWVQAESLAAAAVLAVRTGDPRYWQWYDRIWAYCWTHFVDHEHGAWFRILHRDNRNTTREKSNAGKVDLSLIHI